LSGVGFVVGFSVGVCFVLVGRADGGGGCWTSEVGEGNLDSARKWMSVVGVGVGVFCIGWTGRWIEAAIQSRMRVKRDGLRLGSDNILVTVVVRVVMLGSVVFIA
jgi:hypothetical protein